METLVHNFNPVLPNSLFFRRNSSPRFSFNHVRIISSGNHCHGGNLRMALAAKDPVIQKKIVIPNKYGEKLVGVLHETESPEIVILCHGFRSSKENKTMVNLAVALENEGISAVRFDFAGNGESEGSFQYGNYWREVEDLRSVIQHFSAANRVIRAILGHSKGGNVVLLYASKYRDVYKVVNVSGRYDLTEGIEKRLGKYFMQRIKEHGFIDVKSIQGDFIYRVTEESLMDRLSTNMHKACLQIDKECRVFTVHGSHDTIVRSLDAFEFDKIIPNHKLHVIGGCDHGYVHHQGYLASIVLDFIKDASVTEQGGTTS
ncbi:uncharacterized protein LOC121251922 isoform X1 [Juglans microcarpa x Juglans regia]|uniref:uncharacterized protein LOC121251922 isoform X1 n=3 Tax=Juglans microcarpa x Juglans regia TaxID=2249226 RepID=UPI001B7EA9CC|nr:uncharacterized protein LOC121251922 isoform X1 [Juglans microcarpa x Juglans regia]